MLKLQGARSLGCPCFPQLTCSPVISVGVSPMQHPKVEDKEMPSGYMFRQESKPKSANSSSCPTSVSVVDPFDPSHIPRSGQLPFQSQEIPLLLPSNRPQPSGTRLKFDWLLKFEPETFVPIQV